MANAPVPFLNPYERLIRQAANRPAVGYAPVDVKPIPVDQQTPTARGFTVPVTVTGASVEVFPVDFQRRFIFIQNNDALGIVFVSIGGQGAALNQGFRLGANGGFMLLDINVPTERIFMIGTIANNPNVTAVLG